LHGTLRYSVTKLNYALRARDTLIFRVSRFRFRSIPCRHTFISACWQNFARDISQSWILW